MIQILITSLAGIITFITLDYLWLAKLAKNFYLNNLQSHVVIEKGALVPYLPAVPLVYVVAIIGVWVFVFSKATTTGTAFLYGAILGFVMYAFYDFTNLATLKDYPWSLTILDTLWGTLLVGVVSIVMFLIKDVLG